MSWRYPKSYPKTGQVVSEKLNAGFLPVVEEVNGRINTHNVAAGAFDSSLARILEFTAGAGYVIRAIDFPNVPVTSGTKTLASATFSSRGGPIWIGYKVWVEIPDFVGAPVRSNVYITIDGQKMVEDALADWDGDSAKEGCGGFMFDDRSTGLVIDTIKQVPPGLHSIEAVIALRNDAKTEANFRRGHMFIIEMGR